MGCDYRVQQARETLRRLGMDPGTLRMRAALRYRKMARVLLAHAGASMPTQLTRREQVLILDLIGIRESEFPPPTSPDLYPQHVQITVQPTRLVPDQTRTAWGSVSLSVTAPGPRNDPPHVVWSGWQEKVMLPAFERAPVHGSAALIFHLRFLILAGRRLGDES